MIAFHIFALDHHRQPQLKNTILQLDNCQISLKYRKNSI